VDKERRKRGRPPLGDRSLTRAEHEAKRRARVTGRLNETRVELTNTITDIQNLLMNLAALPTEAGKQAVQARNLASNLQAQVELLLADLGRIHGAASPGTILCRGHIIPVSRYGLGVVWRVAATAVWVASIKGKNGTPRHRAVIPIDDPLQYGISIRYPVVRCD
jgi:hypothetical protein